MAKSYFMDIFGIGRKFNKQKYLVNELKASFKLSHNLAEDLEKITSQYRNCG
jgi:hypothetical protein